MLRIYITKKELLYGTWIRAKEFNSNDLNQVCTNVSKNVNTETR